MRATLSERIDGVCKFEHLLYLVLTIHLMFLVLAAFSVLVGGLTRASETVLSISVLLNLLVLTATVSLLLVCRSQRATIYT